MWIGHVDVDVEQQQQQRQKDGKRVPCNTTPAAAEAAP